MSMISRTTARSRSSAFRPQLQVRQSRANRRFASSESGKSNEAVEKATEYAKKAYGQGAAVAGKAVEGAMKYAGPYGERLSGFGGPLSYNFAVLREILKQVYIRESLAPPKSISEITQAYKYLWAQGSSLQWWRQLVESGGWKKVGIYALEAYGIFHVGEIVGRRHIVGYKLK
ncbi:hypothetical protein FRB91_000224 [Serendipita sp. 411]|nr:hypothetical protein FRC15_001995 [Serendipita sp. 397]KAG8786259.1 hypothetical protein FRC16_001762 [Serendipita sp. 398]KAG8820134.1 hypothetical protein FRC19_009147 [Serendipita sp. 401]KAG8847077.1 hypothetical protein FRB91_000224 [Serendipita sp. 411]KAG8853172.1 hypothetical protein FRC20_001310 [Serendipita sp. 405]